MARILSIDYGRKRCGIAVTDPLQIVATALATVPSASLVKFLQDYTAAEPVEKIIVGYPTDMHGEPSESMKYIRPAVGQIRKALPEIEIVFSDERFTSVLAHRSLIDSGVKKMDRRDKGAIDRISAVIILNDYLNSRNII
ncbi:MAG: Holliday junction resolvase RuvX [Lachnoclostridium sp.]|nr:Holliday junction resolvase RuvX [Lachnoclostridium sp.]